MATRVLVTVQSGVDVTEVVAALTGLGDCTVQPPQPELPDVCVASVDDERVSADAWAAKAATLPGVAAAEVDRLRWSM